MKNLRKIISLSMTFLLLMAFSGVSALALEGTYKNFATFSTTCTFEDGVTLGQGSESIFVANTDTDDTISIEAENGNSFLQVISKDSYPWFATYMGSDATADDVVVKFDYYVNATNGKDRISFHYGSVAKNVMWIDYATLKVLDQTIMGIDKDTWYNIELHTDKAEDSALYRIKKSTDTEWTEAWVTTDGYFDGLEDSALTEIRFAVQKNNEYTARYDNYSHSQENVEEYVRPAVCMYKNFSNFNEVCTFDDTYTFGQENESIFAANTDTDDTISIGTEDGNNFLQVTSTNSYPWFATYMGSDATADDVVVKFDYYVNAANGKDRISFHYDAGTKNVMWIDYANLKVLDKAIMVLDKDTWYNIELHTDKEADSALYRIKKSTDTEWTEAWVTSDGFFDGLENSKLNQIRFAVQNANGYTVRYDNYSHSQENVEKMPLPALYTYLDGYANAVTFSESEEVGHYMFHANVTADTKKTELIEDPTDAENTVFNMRDMGKNYLWIGSFFQGTGDTATLKMSFDFYDANGNNAYEFIRLVTDSNKQPVVTVFKDGYLKYGEEDSNIIGDDGQPFTYEANKWYSITFEANWYQNYVKLGFKEKGAESYRYATMPFFAHFIKCDRESDWLSQIRIGYSSVSADDVSFYIDNYSHSAAPEAVPAEADETKALLPKAVKTDDVITSIKSYVMTLSGEERTAKLLVMLFDEEGNISKVRMSEDVTCSTVTGTPVTIDLTGETFTTYKAFVWSGSNSLTPIDTIAAYKW